VLVQAFRNGEDIHAGPRRRCFGVGPLAQTAEHRAPAKAIQFSASFTALSPFGLAQQLASIRKSREIHQRLFHALSRRKEYLDHLLAETRKTEVATDFVRKNSPDS